MLLYLLTCLKKEEEGIHSFIHHVECSRDSFFHSNDVGITLDFTKHMAKVLAVHVNDMDVVVQPGIKREELNEYTLHHTTPSTLLLD